MIETPNYVETITEQGFGILGCVLLEGLNPFSSVFPILPR